MINKMLDYILNILFPPKCAFCRQFTENSLPICSNCKPTISKDICPACNKCHQECSCDFYFDKLIVPFIYAGNYRNAVLRLKKYPDQNIVKAFSSEMHSFLASTSFDYVVPVPTNKEKLKERGYNQAELLAAEVARLSKKPVVKDILMRTTESLTQHDLNKAKRQDNAFNSYKIGNDKKNIEGATIVLIDDIFTTGATLNACGHILKDCGASHVIGLCATFTAEKLSNNNKLLEQL